MATRRMALVMILSFLTSPGYSFVGSSCGSRTTQRTIHIRMMSAFGYCIGCGVKHSLPTTPEARSAAMDLLQRLQETGRIDFQSDNRFVNPLTLQADLVDDQCGGTAGSDAPIPTTEMTETRGKMLGVLICEYGDETVLLRAFAGAINGRWEIPGWVPPIGGVPHDIPRWAEVQKGVAEMTRQMAAIQYHSGAGRGRGEEQKLVKEEWSQLRARRTALSSESLRLLRANQRVGNFRAADNEATMCTTMKTVEEVYLDSMNERRRLQNTIFSESNEDGKGGGNRTNIKESKRQKKRRLQRMPAILGVPYKVAPKGMPVGVGECCATKLIAFAANHNLRVETALQQQQHRPGDTGNPQLKLLRPVGIAEIFFGTSKQTQKPREGKGFPDTSFVVSPPSPVDTTREKQVKSLVGNDGVFYDACELRCQPVLGFLLCGLNVADFT